MPTDHEPPVALALAAARGYGKIAPDNATGDVSGDAADARTGARHEQSAGGRLTKRQPLAEGQTEELRTEEPMTRLRVPYLLAAVVLTLGVGIAPSQAQSPTKPAKPKVAFCTGQKDGKYEELGKTMQRYVRAAEIEVVNTEGTLDNLDRLAAGSCQVAVVQPDGLSLFKRQSGKSLDFEYISKAHAEYVHLYCHKDADIDRITDLRGKKDALVVLGPRGSGSWIFWSNLVAEDKKYEPVPTTTADTMKRAAATVESDPKACMVVISGLRSKSTNYLNDNYAPTLRLARADDRDLKSVKDAAGKPLYAFAEIPEGTYPAIRPNDRDEIDTISMEAVVIADRALSAEVKDELTGAAKDALKLMSRPQGK